MAKVLHSPQGKLSIWAEQEVDKDDMWAMTVQTVLATFRFSNFPKRNHQIHARVANASTRGLGIVSLDRWPFD